MYYYFFEMLKNFFITICVFILATNWLQKVSEPYKIAGLSGLFAPKANLKCVLL